MQTKQIVLLVNVGSPQSADAEEVAAYLRRFLTDRDILSMPWALRQLLVRTIIMPRRASRSAQRYADLIERCGGIMPLTRQMEQLAAGAAARSAMTVLYAPRYGVRDRKAWGRLLATYAPEESIEVLLLPMYPQYTRSNAGSAITFFADLPKPSGGTFPTRILAPWGDCPEYIDMLSQQIDSCCDTRDDRYHYIGTYHNIPVSHTGYDRARGWDYEAQCAATLRAVMCRAGIPPERYHLAFHSAMGRGAWLSPALTEVLDGLLHAGTDRVVLFSPSFVADCLETLTELDREARNYFMSHGGRELIYVPCLAGHPDAPRLIASLIESL